MRGKDRHHRCPADPLDQGIYSGAFLTSPLRESLPGPVAQPSVCPAAAASWGWVPSPRERRVPGPEKAFERVKSCQVVFSRASCQVCSALRPGLKEKVVHKRGSSSGRGGRWAKNKGQLRNPPQIPHSSCAWLLLCVCVFLFLLELINVLTILRVHHVSV